MSIKKQLEEMVKVNAKSMEDLAVACEAIKKICGEHEAALIINDEDEVCISKIGPDGYRLEIVIGNN